MDDMESSAAPSTVTEFEYSAFNNFTDDYDFDFNDAILCDRTWVRDFREQYEPPLFWIIFILGAFGNLLVVWIYTTMRNRMKTMTDVYLFNLAVADLLFLCTLPFWAAEAVKGWEFGVGLCKFVSAVYKINFFSSMLLLTCISVDRYISIVEVIKAHNFKKKRMFYSKLTCVGVWFVSAFLALPEFMFSQVKIGHDGRNFCALVYWNNVNNRTKILVLALQICMGFCLPLFIMFFCYSVIINTLLRARNFEKHKALRVIFAVVFVFVLSQLPYNSLLIVEATQAANTTITSCSTLKNFDIAGQIAKSLAYTHACLNPFLYVFIGVRFRRDLVRLVQKWICCQSNAMLSKTLTPPPKRPMSETETTNALSL